MRKEKITQVAKGHCKRVLQKSWWRCVEDTRRIASITWHAGYALEVLLAGILSGCRTLREIETFSEMYDERIPDTSLHDIMQCLEPEGLRAELAKGVKQACGAHELDTKEFPVRITAVDGKGLYTTKHPVGDFSEHITSDQKGQYRHMVTRAMIVSTDTKLLLGQREIPSGSHECKEFLPFMDDLRGLYGRTDLLDVISTDAGYASKKNADGLVQRGLNYIVALKGNQGKLHADAVRLLDTAPPTLETQEKYNGCMVTRTLTRIAVDGLRKWKHAREIWKVTSVTYRKSDKKLSTESRYFITSLEASVLSDKHVLAAIRMHWGIENNGHWSLDVAWGEDTAPLSSRSMVLVSYLRMIAFNIIARLKTRKLKAQSHRAIGYKDLFRYFDRALSQLRDEELITNEAVPAFV